MIIFSIVTIFFLSIAGDRGRPFLILLLRQSYSVLSTLYHNITT